MRLCLCSLSWLIVCIARLVQFYFWRAFLFCVAASIKTVDRHYLRVCIRVFISTVFCLLFSFPYCRGAVCVLLELLYTDANESQESIRLLWSSGYTEFVSRWFLLGVHWSCSLHHCTLLLISALVGWRWHRHPAVLALSFWGGTIPQHAPRAAVRFTTLPGPQRGLATFLRIRATRYLFTAIRVPCIGHL